MVGVNVLAALYGDPGTFTPHGGSPIAVRVVMRRNDPDIRVFDTNVRNPGWTAENLRQSEVPNRPEDGDLLTVTAGEYPGSYVVTDVQEDVESLTWTLHLSEAA